MDASKETSVKRHGETEDDPVVYPEHGMPLEQAEALMAFLSTCSPTGQAYARAQQEEADAKQARIESWVHTTQVAQNASTSISPAMGTG
jgi:hypothetical protein